MKSLPTRGIAALALIGGALLLCLTGCGAGTGDVSGTVTYKGSNLKGGTVTFASTTGGPSFTGMIKPDGTYTVQGVRSGDYKICVETESLKPRAANTGGPSKGGSGSGSKGGPPGMKMPPGGGGPDPMKDFKSGKIKAGPPGGSDEPEEVREKRGQDGFAYMLENAKNYVPIPTDYSNPDTTQLSYTATKGAQTHDIVINPK